MKDLNQSKFGAWWSVPHLLGTGLVFAATLGSSLCAASTAVAQTPAGVAPTQAAPQESPAVPTEIPQPPTGAQSAQGAAGAQDGQWTYTSQYGWVWMPYAAGYTAVTPDAGTAYEYVYQPTYGWQWVAAPWVLGWGPTPYWGPLGLGRFAWHTHPWFGVGGIRGGGVYGGFRGGGFHGGGFRGGGVYGGFHGRGFHGGGFRGGGFHGGGRR